jgi:phosphohistidine phosphatase SixA
MLSRRSLLLGGAALVLSPVAFGDDRALWDRLRAGGLVLLMRHASTGEGLGDPANFELGDCSTQRNLSEQGRREARRVGERFREERVVVEKVLTSPWCRCRETAMLAFGQAEDWTPLSSVFDYPHQEPEFTERVKKRIGNYARRKLAGNVVMVTHNVNIAALSKYSVAPAELVLMRPDGCCNAKPLERLKVA